MLDAIQETIILAYSSIRKLINVKSFKTWIIKILINKCNEIYKEKTTSKTVPLDAYELEKYSLNKEDDFSSVEFESLMSVLSKEEKTIMILYYSEKYTTKEISKILGINESTIRSKISRIKKKLKIILEGV